MLLARPDARDERALLLQVFGDLLLLEDDHRVEVGEADHHQEVDHVVLQRVRTEERCQVLAAASRTHARLEPVKKLAIMPGKTMMLTAKISGIMPAELTFSGMCVVLPPYCAVAAHPLARGGPGCAAAPR